jgi:phage baseplate assembly protein W
MRDLRVVQTKTTLPITSIAPIRGFEPPSIIILGDKYQYAEEIFYNGAEVREFVISSPQRIVARIPDEQLGRPMTSVTIITTIPAANNTSLLSMGLSKLNRSVAGIDKLVQDWMLIFLTNPGSDIFDPDVGGGARAIIGKPVYGGGASAMADLSLAVSRTREQLLRLQSKYPGIPPAERLLSASLTDVRFDNTTTTLTAVVDLQNMVGASASVTVR